MNKSLKIITIAMILMLCLSFSASAANDKIKTKEQVVQEKIDNKQFVKYQTYHDKNKFDRAIGGQDLGIRVMSNKHKVPAGFEAPQDEPMTMISFKNNNKIHIIDPSHKIETIQVPWNEITALPGFDGETVLITHYNDFGIKDGVWIQYVYNIDGFAYLEEIPFSEVVVSGFTGTYTKTDNLITPNDIVNLGYTFDSDDVQYLNISVTDQYPNKTDPYDINTTGLVGWWRFDEGSGTNVSDSSGNGNHGAFTAANYTNGKYNDGGDFDGIDDFVDVGDIGINNETFSIATWINLTEQDAVTSVITGKGINYNLRVTSANQLSFLLQNASTVYTTVSNTGLVPENELAFVYADFDVNENQARLYINNEEVTYSGQPTIPGPIDVNSDVLYFARRSDGSYFEGQIDDILIYNRTLSDEERNQLYYIKTSQLATRTNSNSTYSGLWNDSTDNPISIPIGAGESISNLRFDNTSSIEQNGITIYEPENMLFNVSVEIGHLENTTNIYEEVNGDSYQVFIQHIPGVDSVSGTVEFTSDPNDILSSPFLTTGMNTNNTNASLNYNVATRVWTVTTGSVVAGQEYNYVLYGVLEGSTLENIVEGGFGNDNMEPFKATGNDTIIVGSTFTATTPTDALWGNRGNDLAGDTGGLIVLSGVVAAVAIFLIELRRRKE